ncbi:Serine/threonine-protein kinase PrkC [Tolypocladium ophioglossoides CBS 100239]|uniref:Serine/threonine-protein kinase PrkC n=1 Tax=Tolypocladium ophioglossoides (strain CBS 100239) TaxID=1163406 RepID=A0A0L0N0P0_TOLOC|nr:Serine/threonine-protein kinase PrkC [Tolypocladium ophioglossoides CBS 100239]
MAARKQPSLSSRRTNARTEAEDTNMRLMLRQEYEGLPGGRRQSVAGRGSYANTSCSPRVNPFAGAGAPHLLASRELVAPFKYRSEEDQYATASVSPVIAATTAGSGHDSDYDERGYRVLCDIGRGGFGKVTKVQKRNDERTVFARKEIKLPSSEIPNEVELLRRASPWKHQHVVQLVDHYKRPGMPMDSHFIVMLPVAEKTLQAYVLEIENMDPISPQSWAQFGPRRKWLLSSVPCLAGAVAFLNSQGIRHRDIKPENILVHGDNILLTDFGISFAYTGETEGGLTPTLGTFEYLPPEALSGEEQTRTPAAHHRRRVGRSGDVWSMGCVMLEMLRAASHPFANYFPLVIGDYASCLTEERFLLRISRVRECRTRLRKKCAEADRLEGLLGCWLPLVMKRALSNSVEERMSAAELCAVLCKTAQDVLGSQPVNSCRVCRDTYGDVVNAGVPAVHFGI